MSVSFLKLSIGICLLFYLMPLSADFRGELGIEYQYFKDDSLFQGQGDDALSVTVEPTWSFSSDDSKNLYDISLFYREDFNDSERSHGDIRELSWIHTSGDWEFRAGIRKEFWGVAETRHLVDIINQTDSVDRFDGEVKLGQPMFNVSRRTSFGDFDIFVLPYFRERTFAGIDGRLRSGLLVDSDNVNYESSKGQSNIDYAGRWVHSFGVWDVGLSYFDGTGREPILMLSGSGDSLIPNYVLIKQLGVDAQVTLGSWLYKFEAINRRSSENFPSESFSEAIIGFEKSFFDVKGFGADIGLLYEYSDSDRQNSMMESVGNAHFLGVRLALNDEQSTDLLLGCDAGASFCLLEGSRRLGDDYKLSLRANVFTDIDEVTGLDFLEQDDFLQFNLSYFF